MEDGEDLDYEFAQPKSFTMEELVHKNLFVCGYPAEVSKGNLVVKSYYYLYS